MQYEIKPSMYLPRRPVKQKGITVTKHEDGSC